MKLTQNEIQNLGLEKAVSLGKIPLNELTRGQQEYIHYMGYSELDIYSKTYSENIGLKKFLKSIKI